MALLVHSPQHRMDLSVQYNGPLHLLQVKSSSIFQYKKALGTDRMLLRDHCSMSIPQTLVCRHNPFCAGWHLLLRYIVWFASSRAIRLSAADSFASSSPVHCLLFIASCSLPLVHCLLFNVCLLLVTLLNLK